MKKGLSDCVFCNHSFQTVWLLCSKPQHSGIRIQPQKKKQLQSLFLLKPPTVASLHPPNDHTKLCLRTETVLLSRNNDDRKRGEKKQHKRENEKKKSLPLCDSTGLTWTAVRVAAKKKKSEQKQ